MRALGTKFESIDDFECPARLNDQAAVVVFCLQSRLFLPVFDPGGLLMKGDRIHAVIPVFGADQTAQEQLCKSRAFSRVLICPGRVHADIHALDHPIAGAYRFHDGADPPQLFANRKILHVIHAAYRDQLVGIDPQNILVVTGMLK